jgi:vancomycin resistance protein YoaR
MSIDGIKKRRRKRLAWVRYLAGLFLIIIILLGGYLSYQELYNGKVYPGVRLGQIDLSSRTFDEVQEVLREEVEQINQEGLFFIGYGPEKKKKEISVSPVLIALTDPDLSRQIINFDLERTVNGISAIGRRKNFLKSLEERLRGFFSYYQVPLFFQINEEELVAILKNNFNSLENPAQDARLQVEEDGQFIIAPERAGQVFDYQKAIDKLKINLKNLSRQPVELFLETDLPRIKSQDCNEVLVEAQRSAELFPITFRFEDKNWPVTPDLGKDWLKIGLEEGKIQLIFDQEKVFSFLETIALEIDIFPQDAKFKIEDSRVTEFQPSLDGRALNLEKTLAKAIDQFIEQGEKEIELIVDKLEPKVPIEDINDLGIKELIGRGESCFAGSPANRRHNIAVGAEILHGLLIEPGEEFSLVKAIGEVNAARGFLQELVIKGDETIPEYGGGLCQIGTTNFRVALDAGLPITARTPHSYRVSYYEPAGTDATVYNPQPDLKFINDTGYHILFQTEIDGNDLIFEFYGTPDGRQVEISQPKIFNLVRPGEAKYIETDELEPGEKKRIEYPHTGADTVFTRKIIYPNGEEKEEKWRSHYKAWQEVWLVGKEPEEEEEEVGEENKEE